MGPYLAQPIKQKKTDRKTDFKLKLKYSSCEMQGWRRNMQDASICKLDLGNNNALFAVFDGHGGPQVSRYVQKIFAQQLISCKAYKEEKYKQALLETFKKVDEMISSKQGEEGLNLIRKSFDGSVANNKISNGCGCTANVVLITPNKIICANAGDSRAVLSQNGKAISLSKDHKPEDPQQLKRIKQAGGEVIHGRVNGGLNLSRSLGDFNYKQSANKPWRQQMITAQPDVEQMQRKQGDKNQFILIGCDGIWQKFVKDPQPLITRIGNQKRANIDGVDILRNLFDFLLASDTNEQTGCDNMTAILVEFV